MKRKCFKCIIVLLICILSFTISGCERKRNLTEFIFSLRERSQSEEVSNITEGSMDKKSIEEKSVEEISTEEVIDEEPEKEGIGQREIELADLEEAYQIILDTCSGEFIGYHLIDDTFLNWLSYEYGSEVLMNVATAVKNGNQDKNIWYELTGSSIHVLWLLYCQQSGFQSYQLDRVTWQVCRNRSETVLNFTGDINFAEGYVTTTHMDSSPNGIRDCFSEDLLEEMNNADVMMINNEFTYSTRGTALAGKAYTFRANPKRVELLSVFGTDIVSIANNHVYDFGPEALLDTISTLDQAGVPHVGAGANISEAEKPYYFVCNGRKIAIVSATQIERSLNYTKEATENSPGVLKALNPDRFVEVIKYAKRNSDCVIAMVHWGTEGDSNYGKDQENLAKAFANAGADAIIGGHTHCLQGCEFVEGVPTIYSLGNFWFSASTQDTGLAQVVIDKSGKVNLRFIPCIQQGVRTSLVTDEGNKKRILEFMQKHSAKGTIIDENGWVKQAAE